MRENRTCSLSGGRWPARKRATSDPTPAKCPNKGEQAPTEGMEGRRPTKENIGQATPPRTQSRTSELSDLRGVREVARRVNLIPTCASTPGIRGRSRMQQFCTYGSVRGAPGNRRPYRDKSLRSLLPLLTSATSGRDKGEKFESVKFMKYTKLGRTG